MRIAYTVHPMKWDSVSNCLVMAPGDEATVWGVSSRKVGSIDSGACRMFSSRDVAVSFIESSHATLRREQVERFKDIVKAMGVGVVAALLLTLFGGSDAIL